MARRKEAATVETVSDYGASIGRDRDGRLVSSGPAQVMLEDAEDIDYELNKNARRPLVRRARRWCVLRGMLKTGKDGALLDGSITVRQYDAANRFLGDCSRAQGGSQASFLNLVVSGSAGRDAFTEDQRIAMRKVMEVRHLLGLNSGTIFWWVVLENKSPREYAAWKKIRWSTAYTMLKDSLSAVDAYYYPPASGREGVITRL